MDDLLQLSYKYAAPVFIRDALRRRFLGVVGVAHHVMQAMVEVVHGPPAFLRLKIKDAKLSADHADGGRPQISGVPPLITAVLDADVANQVIINNITKEQLQAIDIKAPVLSDGEHTDKVIYISQSEAGADAARAKVMQCIVDPNSNHTVYFVRCNNNSIITKTLQEIQAAIDAHSGRDEAEEEDGQDPGQRDGGSSSTWRPGASPADARVDSGASGGALPLLPPRHPSVSISPLAKFANLKKLFPDSFSAANFVWLQKLEELAMVLCTEESGQLPMDAITPRESADARLAYIDEQLAMFEAARITITRAGPTFDSVFTSARAIKAAWRAASRGSASRGAAGGISNSSSVFHNSSPLDSSFSRLAANHTMYSMNRRAAGPDPDDGGMQDISAAAVAAQQDAIAVEREGSLPAHQRPLQSAAAALVPLSQNVANDQVALGQLGAALHSLDPALVRLGESDSSAINANSSECLSNTIRDLATARGALASGMGMRLLKELRVDVNTPSKDRIKQLNEAAKNLLSFKFNKISEGKLLSSDAKGLLSSMEAGSMETSLKVLRALDRTASLFDPPPPGELGLFGAAEELAETLISGHGACASDVANMILECIEVKEREMEDFLAKRRALRPHLSRDAFTSTRALELITEIKQQATADKRARKAIREELEAKGITSSTTRATHGPQDPSNPSNKKQRKAQAKAQTAASSAAAAGTVAAAGLTETIKLWDGRDVPKASYNVHNNADFAGPPQQVRPQPPMLAEFSRNNGRKCWDFCMRGQCARSVNLKACTFVHQPL
jgi:hypothetical protein